jgi:hypothetical protein
VHQVVVEIQEGEAAVLVEVHRGGAQLQLGLAAAAHPQTVIGGERTIQQRFGPFLGAGGGHLDLTILVCEARDSAGSVDTLVVLRCLRAERRLKGGEAQESHQESTHMFHRHGTSPTGLLVLQTAPYRDKR